MKKKGIDSSEDVSVLLENALHYAYAHMKSGDVPVHLYWRPNHDIICLIEESNNKSSDPHAKFYEEIGAREPVQFDNIDWPLLKVYTEESKGHDFDTLHPLEWVKRESTLLAPSLFTGFFSKQTYSVPASMFQWWQKDVKERELAFPHRDELLIGDEEQAMVLMEEPLRRTYWILKERGAECACLFWNTNQVDVMGIWAVEDTEKFNLGGVEPYVIYIAQLLDSTQSEEEWVEENIRLMTERASKHFFKQRECYVSINHWQQSVRNAKIVKKVREQAIEKRITDLASRRERLS